MVRSCSMTFLNSFEVVRYRGLDGVSFPNLTQANLVTGVNGVGKTAALEAMWLFTGRYNIPLLWNHHVQRTRKPILDPVGRITRGFLELKGTERGSPQSMKTNFEKIADIRASEEMPTQPSGGNAFVGPPVIGRIHTELNDSKNNGGINSLYLTPWGAVAYQSPQGQSKDRPNFVYLSTIFQHETASEYLTRYSDIVRENRKDKFKCSVNLILPRIKDVEILTDESGESYLSAETTDGTLLPLHDLGGGMVRLYQLFLNFFASRGGVFFSDEIENGLHHSIMGEVWTRSREWMREWNVQFVATTHSDECIKAAIAAFEDAPYDLSIHKLFLNPKTGQVETTTFTGESLEGARDLNLEIR